MPIIQVSMVAGRGPEKISQLVAELTEVTARVLDAPADTIKILVTELQPTHWGSGGETIEARRSKGSK